MKKLTSIMLSIVMLMLMLSPLSVFASSDMTKNNTLQVAYITNSSPIVGEKLRVVTYYYTAAYGKIPTLADDASGIKYTWYKNTDKAQNELICETETPYYTVTEDDYGSFIYCTVSSDNVTYYKEAKTLPTKSVSREGFELARTMIDGNTGIGSKVNAYVYPSVIDTAISENRKLYGSIYGENVLDIKWYKTKTYSNSSSATLIENANDMTYTIKPDDVGYYIYFTAEGKNGYSGSVVSELFYVDGIEKSTAGAAVVITPPKKLNIRGSFVVGATVYCDAEKNTDWYRWYRNDVQSNSGGELIEGVHGGFYTLAEEDLGKYIYAENIAYKETVVSPVSEVVKSSADVAQAKILDAEYATKRYDISIECDTYGALLDIQWFRCSDKDMNSSEKIIGAKNMVYYPKSEDVGKYIYAIVTPVSPFMGEAIKTNVTEKVSDTALIRFDPNGGVAYINWEIINCGTSCGEFFSNFEDYVERNGYRLKGWSTDKNALVPNFDENTIVNDDITLYVVWENVADSEVQFSIENNSYYENGSVKVSLLNKAAKSQTVTVVYAYYDKNGSCLDIESETMLLSPNVSENKEHKIPDSVKDKVASIKVFVWDSIDTMTPLADAKSIDF